MASVVVLVALRWITGVAAVALFGDLAIQDSDLLGGWRVLTWIVFLAGFTILLVTIPTVAARLPRLSIRRARNRLTIEYVPPTWQGTKILKRRAGEASKDVLGLLAECSRTDPARTPWFSEPGWDQKTDEEKHAAWVEHGEKSYDHYSEYMRRYEVEYSAEALTLFDLITVRGLPSKVERRTFEWPVNTQGIREVGQQLGVWARQL